MSSDGASAIISARSVVSLRYRVTDTLGELIAANDAPETFLMGSDDLLPKIQQQLIGQTAGFSLRLQLEPDDAFGDYDAQLMRVEQRSLFPPGTAPGMQFDGLPPGCSDADPGRIYTVTDVTDEVVVLDGNHPLAGIAVRFELQVLAVRDATDDELEAGSALGAEGASSLRVLDKPLPPDGRMH
jgi:FKBP-type peptidyl-prolyl cis-trans isomerase SlyD